MSPVIPARTCGPPEDCYPEEGGELDPEECPKCGAAFDSAALREKGDDAAEAAEEAYWEDKAESRREDADFDSRH